jgi:hypothetical protein
VVAAVHAAIAVATAAIAATTVPTVTQLASIVARFGRRFLSIRLSPSLSVSFARDRQSFLARGLLSDHRRFKRLDEGNDAGRCCFRVQVNEIAQVEKARHAALVTLAARLREIDIDRLV